MNDTQKTSILISVFIISVFIGASMIVGLLFLAIALYDEKTLFKHLSITKKNILFCFAIISSPIWCPIFVYGKLIYSLIYICSSNTLNIETPIETTVEVTTENIPIATAELIVL
jgi:hypothetical protein